MKVSKTDDLKPGASVPRSAIYRVYHHAHRLMHEAALIAGELFPSCRQCNDEVRFELLRMMGDHEILPFNSGEILEVYSKEKNIKKAV